MLVLLAQVMVNTMNRSLTTNFQKLLMHGEIQVKTHKKPQNLKRKLDLMIILIIKLLIRHQQRKVVSLPVFQLKMDLTILILAKSLPSKVDRKAQIPNSKTPNTASSKAAGNVTNCFLPIKPLSIQKTLKSLSAHKTASTNLLLKTKSAANQLNVITNS